MDIEHHRQLAARQLAQAIAELSLKHLKECWAAGFERAVWNDLLGGESVLDLTQDEKALLMGLSRACGGWVRWSPTTCVAPLGDKWLRNVEHIPLPRWMDMYAKSNSG